MKHPPHPPPVNDKATLSEREAALLLESGLSEYVARRHSHPCRGRSSAFCLSPPSYNGAHTSAAIHRHKDFDDALATPSVTGHARAVAATIARMNMTRSVGRPFCPQRALLIMCASVY